MTVRAMRAGLLVAVLGLVLGRCECYGGFNAMLAPVPVSCSTEISEMQRGRCAHGRLTRTARRPTAMSASSSTWGSKLAAAAASSILLLAPSVHDVALAAGAGAAPFVIDEAKAIPSGQEARIEQRLDTLAEETGFRVRVLTRDGRTPGKTGPEIKELWGLPDEKCQCHALLFVFGWCDCRMGSLHCPGSERCCRDRHAPLQRRHRCTR